MAEPEFSSLPGLVLVHLFKMLPVSDRGRLASCSRRLATFMDAPSLWREVTITLEMPELLPGQSVHLSFFQRLYARDLVMIQRYGRYLKRAKLAMSSGWLQPQSWTLLTELCQRHVIKSVSLRFDMFHSQIKKWEEKSPDPIAVSGWGYKHLKKSLFSWAKTGLWVFKSTAADVIHRLSSDAHLSVILPPQNCEPSWDSLFRNSFYTMHFYAAPKSDKCCSLLRKLVLSFSPVPEEDIARKLEKVPMSSLSTTQLVSSFPNLEELHLDIINLSDQLLLELAGAPERRKPLRSLVIRHVPECGPRWHVFAFPQLSSAAWDRLAQSSPSLTVECSVVNKRLPQLLDVIKPDTPLVRLEVLCYTTSSDDQSVPVLEELSNQHSGLCVVGVRLHARLCANSDS